MDYCGVGMVPDMGSSGRRAKRSAEDLARVGELRVADANARVAARPSLLRQLFGRATPYGGYTPAEAARAIAADDGEQGTAVVLAAEDRPGRRFVNPPGGTVDLLLEVIRPGGDRYTTHLVVGFSTPERRARVATVGTRLPVRIDPDKPGKIAIDTTVLFGQ
jgi:xanthine/CO dehydrogenase XdhC/CoxF family maturation factor